MNQFSRWAYQMTGYYSQCHNGIISGSSTDSSYSRRYLNSDKSTNYGLESEFKYKLESWLFQLNIAYSQSENSIRLQMKIM